MRLSELLEDKRTAPSTSPRLRLSQVLSRPSTRLSSIEGQQESIQLDANALEANRIQEAETKKKASLMQTVVQKAQELAKLNPVNWTAQQTVDFFKKRPPQNLQEQAKANAAIELKKKQEEELTKRLLPEDEREAEGATGFKQFLNFTGEKTGEFLGGVAEELPFGRVERTLESVGERLPQFKFFTDLMTEAHPALQQSGILRELAEGSEGIERKIGNAVGTLGTLATIGSAAAPIAGATAASPIFNILPKFQSIARFAGARMAQTGATFGIEQLTRSLNEVAEQEGDPDLPQVGAEILKAMAFGTGLGAVGSIAHPAFRIPAEAAYGFGVAKLEGASTLEAGLNGALFGLFGLFNRRNLSKEYKLSALLGMRQAVVEQVQKAGASKEQVQAFTDQGVQFLAAKLMKDENIRPQDIDDFAKELVKRVKLKKPEPAKTQPLKGLETKQEPIKPPKVKRKIKKLSEVSTEGVSLKQELLNEIEEAKANIKSDVPTVKFKMGNADVTIENKLEALEEFSKRLKQGVKIEAIDVKPQRVKLSESLGFPAPTERPPDLVSDPTVGHHEMPMRLEKPAGVIPPTSAVDVMDALADVIKAAGGKVPVRTGKILPQQKAIGIFKIRPEVIRIKTANDIPTAIHETGHALEKLVYGWKKSGPWKSPLVDSKMQKELSNLGFMLYGPRIPNGGYKREGFAEFLRLWVTNPNQLKPHAPLFTKWFNAQFLKDHSDISQALNKAKELAQRFQEEGSVARAKASIVDLGSIKERTRLAIESVKKGLSVQNHIEMLQPLFVVSKEAESKLGRPLHPTEDPYFTAKALRMTHDARTRVMVNESMIDIAGNPVGPPLADITSLVKNRKEDFSIYLWAKRAEALWKDPNKPGGRNPGLSLKDSEQIISELETSEFQLAAQKVYDWNDGVLNYAAQASNDFAKTVEKIREIDPGYYVPLAREFRELNNLWARASARAGSAQLSARLKGSGRRVKDIFPQMISNARAIIKSAHNRIVLEQVIKLSKIEGMGHFVEKIPREQIPAYSSTIEELLNRINKELAAEGAGVKLTGKPSEDILGESITFFMPENRPTGKDPIIPVWKDGKLEFYQVDGELFDALQSMEVYRLPQLASLPVLDWIFGKPARVFRAGTTGLRPTFGLITNPLRDLQTLYMNSQTNVNALHLFGGWLKSIVDAGFRRVGVNTKDPYLDAFIKLGGEMAQPLGQDIEQTRRAARELFQGRIIRTLDPRNIFDFIREILQFPETGSRVAELREVAKQVGWKPGEPMTFDQSLKLLLAAKEVTTDFTAAGSLSRVINQMIPFYNAAIQGPRANIRAAKRNPKRFILKGLLGVTIPTLLLWWNNKDEEWYKEMPARDKFSFWYFPAEVIDETLVRIPRAFEIGQVFGSMPEAFIDAWYRQDPEAVNEWFGTFLEVSSPLALPVLLDEGFEQALNRDVYWDRPIVPQAMEKKASEEQYDEYTTSLAVTLGDIFNVSPKRIDHGIRGLFGNVAGDILEAVNLGAEGRERETTSADIPLVGVLFKRGGELGTNQKSVSKLYDLLEKATQKQYSDKQAETPKERQLRLMLIDATRAVSAIGYVRSHTYETDKQRLLTQESLRIAQDVIKNYESGNVQRGHFAGRRKKYQREKKLLESK